jgi:lipoprotein NlpD
MGLLLFACSSPPAPVEDRSTSSGSANSSRKVYNGKYRVSRGETLYSIAFSYGLDWKDVARWNGVGSPYTIYPGQELRLTAPPSRSGTTSTQIETRPAGSTPTATTRAAEAPPPKAPAPEPGSSAPIASTSASSQQSATPAVETPSTAPPSGPLNDPERWLWPTKGKVISSFSAGDPARKGINISGQEGQDIVASAAGDVVYSGNGLIGFGELIIIKHSDRMLTAYAHNRRRLVEEGERVAAGGKIAEMGRNDQEKIMLHFELRVAGKPVDPLRYLPSR